MLKTLWLARRPDALELLAIAVPLKFLPIASRGAFPHWKKGFARGACFVYCLAHEVEVSGFFSCPMAGERD
jgi:hypothetical protein